MEDAQCDAIGGIRPAVVGGQGRDPRILCDQNSNADELNEGMNEWHN